MTMRDFWNKTLLEPLETIGTRIMHFLPNLFAAIMILGVGLLLARLLGYGAERLLRMLGVDHLADQLGVNTVLTRTGLKPVLSHLVGRLLYWGLVILTAIASLSALDVAAINRLATSFLNYLPHVLSAAVILLVGMFLSNFVARTTLIAAVNANFPAAATAAGLARWGVLLAALAMALEQLGIAESIVVVGFGITLGGVVLAAAIALGLGAKDLAKEFLERMLSDKPRDRMPDDLKHL
jgi:mechanosensitive ion channel-like protein